MAYQEILDRSVKKIATLDFSSERKTMSTVVIGYDGKLSNTVLLKGAPERVIEKCSTVSTSTGIQSALTAANKAELIEKIKKVASQGYRVLGIAIGLDGGNMKNVTTANASTELEDQSSYDKFESGLSFVGYVCIKDPVRPEVKDAIQSCRNAGINVIMITGDAKETAVAVA